MGHKSNPNCLYRSRAGGPLASYRAFALMFLEKLFAQPDLARRDLYKFIVVEIDGKHPLIDDFVIHERNRPACRLGYIIIGLVIAEPGGCGGCAERDQHLIPAGTDGHLLDRKSTRLNSSH